MKERGHLGASLGQEGSRYSCLLSGGLSALAQVQGSDHSLTTGLAGQPSKAGQGWKHTVKKFKEDTLLPRAN